MYFFTLNKYKKQNFWRLFVLVFKFWLFKISSDVLVHFVALVDFWAILMNYISAVWLFFSSNNAAFKLLAFYPKNCWQKFKAFITTFILKCLFFLLQNNSSCWPDMLWVSYFDNNSEKKILKKLKQLKFFKGYFQIFYISCWFYKAWKTIYK